MAKNKKPSQKKSGAKLTEGQKKNAPKAPDGFLFDDCVICQAERNAQKSGRGMSLEELQAAFREAEKQGAVVGGPLLEETVNIKKNKRERMKERGFVYVGEADGEEFAVPTWMDCTWKRVPCGKSKCPICGRMERDSAGHIEKSEDPESIESAIEDMEHNLSEALAVIKEDARAKGIDLANLENIVPPPKPDAFPLWKKVFNWSKCLSDLGLKAKEEGRSWTMTEAADDLFWYKETLCTKTYRQLVSRFEIEAGSDYGNFDYAYTKGVLNECARILEDSLGTLSSIASPQQKKIAASLDELKGLKKEIFAI